MEENVKNINEMENQNIVTLENMTIRELRKKRSDVYHKARYYSQKGKDVTEIKKELEEIKTEIAKRKESK